MVKLGKSYLTTMLSKILYIDLAPITIADDIDTVLAKVIDALGGCGMAGEEVCHAVGVIYV